MTWQHILNISYQDITRQIFIFILYSCFLWIANGIGDVIVIVLASSAVDRGFEPGSGQIKVNKIGICCFSAKHATLRTKSKDWLARNQDNVSEWSDMSTHGLLFQWASTITVQLSTTYGKIMLIILFTRYEYSWRLGTTWHFSATLGRILFF